MYNPSQNVRFTFFRQVIHTTPTLDRKANGQSRLCKQWLGDLLHGLRRRPTTRQIAAQGFLVGIGPMPSNLGVVRIASIGLLLAVWKVKPRKPPWAHRIALIGIMFFCI